MPPLPTTHNHLLIKAVYLWVTASTERETRAERLGVLLQHPFIPRATLPPSQSARPGLRGSACSFSIPSSPGLLCHHVSTTYNTQPSVNKSCISLGDSQHRARDPG
ncbi:hypothetical protein J6590_011244 [Homalodisca vitripennis]|nr:hypothetical protein J6590_011244 [Homalodisca vitripennis]